MKTDAKNRVVILCAFALVFLQSSVQGASQLGSLPLWFDSADASQFTARAQGSEFVVSPDGVQFGLQKSGGQTARCTMRFVGAAAAPTIAGLDPLTGRINRLFGNDPSQWQVNLPAFSRVQLAEVYPGVSVVFYGNQKMLEYDFNLAAGKNPDQIGLRFDGVKKISIAKDGSLVLDLGSGKVVQHPPIAYQMIHGERREISASYKILDARTVGFAVGRYDPTVPLVIDPVLTYSSYFGGQYGETASVIAVNTNDGSIYIAGQTLSAQVSNNIPLATSSAYQKTYKGGKFTGDAFIVRFDSTGTNLIYATYLGGSNNDGVRGLAVNGAGCAIVAGYTDSPNFPTTNALYPKIRSTLIPNLKTYAVDAFVTKLNPAGNALVYSTYLGGSSMDAAYGLALDDAENVYVTGYTYSGNFPVTPNAFQSKKGFAITNGYAYFNCNAFISVLSANGSNLTYSTYLGGTNFDVGQAIALNSSRLFVGGYTYSTNFPKTNYLGGYKYLNGDSGTKKLNGASDAFVTAFQISSTNLYPLYSTLLGGTNSDAAYGIAADAAGNAYVAGYTLSTNFPYTTVGVPNLTPAYVHTNDFKKRPQIATNGFLTKILWNETSPAIGFSTMFGGRGVNVANGVTLDSAGNAYVIGSIGSTNLPVTPSLIESPLSATNSSRKKNGQYLSDAAVLVFNQDATALLYGAYLGGWESDYGYAIAVDPDGNIYLAGQTLSENFPTVSPWKSVRTGTNDMFLAKISADGPPALTIAPAEVVSAPAGAETIPAAGQPVGSYKLKWKMFPPIYQLESATDMTQPDWHAASQSPVYSNGWYELHLSGTNQAEFFRLKRP